MGLSKLVVPEFELRLATRVQANLKLAELARRIVTGADRDAAGGRQQADVRGAVPR